MKQDIVIYNFFLFYKFFFFLYEDISSRNYIKMYRKFKLLVETKKKTLYFFYFYVLILFEIRVLIYKNFNILIEIL